MRSTGELGVCWADSVLTTARDASHSFANGHAFACVHMLPDPVVRNLQEPLLLPCSRAPSRDAEP
jgi:hypothetical protein